MRRNGLKWSMAGDLPIGHISLLASLWAHTIVYASF